jgi:hypothetical protein
VRHLPEDARQEFAAAWLKALSARRYDDFDDYGPVPPPEVPE